MFLILRVFAVLMPLFTSGLALAQVAPPSVVSAVRFEWSKVAPEDAKGPPFWNDRVSPGFPCAWPKKEGGPLCYYAYAAAFDPQLADGERTAAPWAKVKVDPAQKTPPKVELLMKEMREIGIQGVRPLKKDDVEGGKFAYCSWIKNNGVIAAELRKIHPEFFDSLGCR